MNLFWSDAAVSESNMLTSGISSLKGSLSDAVIVMSQISDILSRLSLAHIASWNNFPSDDFSNRLPSKTNSINVLLTSADWALHCLTVFSLTSSKQTHGYRNPRDSLTLLLFSAEDEDQLLLHFLTFMLRFIPGRVSDSGVNLSLGLWLDCWKTADPSRFSSMTRI